MWVLLRVTAVVPSTPGIHVPAVHTASSDVGIELPATWRNIKFPVKLPHHFGIMVHTPVVLPFIAIVILHYLRLKSFIISFNFFQNFHGTFNI